MCPRFLPNIGGIETHVYEISKRLSRKHKVLVYTTDPTGKLPKEEVIKNIKIKRFKSYAPNQAFYFSPQLYFALKKESCDVLHVHSFQAFPAFLAYLAMDKNRVKKLIFTPHYHPKGGTVFRSFLRKFYDGIQKQILINADKVVCVSNYERKILNKKFNIPFKKMIYIPNGIDAEKFEKLPKVKKVFDFQILFVGRLEKYKRVQWILNSLKRLIEIYPNKKIHLVIVGDGPYKKKLTDIIAKSNVQNYVEFKSKLPSKKLLEEFCKCDIFIMPSEYEAFSIVTLEALACKKPVIANKTGGLTELVDKRFLIQSQDDMLKKLLYFLKNRPKVNFNLKKYSWDQIANNLDKIYR